MHDDASFLAAVVDAPEDDLLRAVYADWLEERGDSRADYLRTEMVLVGMSEEDPGYFGVEARLRELRQAVDAEWVNLAGRRYRVEFEPPSPGQLGGLGLLASLFGGVDLTVFRGVFTAVTQSLFQPLPREQAERLRDAVLDSLPWPAIRPHVRIKVCRAVTAIVEAQNVVAKESQTSAA
jgi:uncharacterized protein (TIGR02996 family)